MSTFVISKRFFGDYKFEFTSRKGKTIFTSVAHELRMDCEAAVEMLKNSFDQCEFKKQKSQSGYFFKLFFNNEHLATSRKYSTELMLEKGIKEILEYGSQSETLDFSTLTNIFED